LGILGKFLESFTQKDPSICRAITKFGSSIGGKHGADDFGLSFKEMHENHEFIFDISKFQ
jgi:hypothetical protein